MRMRELTNKLMEEYPIVKIERKEVWHDKRNMEFIKECDKGDACGGGPFYFNATNKPWRCGGVAEYELNEVGGVE